MPDVAALVEIPVPQAVACCPVCSGPLVVDPGLLAEGATAVFCRADMDRFAAAFRARTESALMGYERVAHDLDRTLWEAPTAAALAWAAAKEGTPNA